LDVYVAVGNHRLALYPQVCNGSAFG
jgi:hypothetical protein